MTHPELSCNATVAPCTAIHSFIQDNLPELFHIVNVQVAVGMPFYNTAVVRVAEDGPVVTRTA